MTWTVVKKGKKRLDENRHGDIEEGCGGWLGRERQEQKEGRRKESLKTTVSKLETSLEEVGDSGYTRENSPGYTRE
ncbi:Proteasome-associated protein ECM29-like protein [Sesbania bispinosa]|nr:Proteasome-associated protein ECM29-like protein [Sesbania bispinosa]